MDGSGANAHPAVARALAANGKRTIHRLSQQGATFVQRALQHYISRDRRCWRRRGGRSQGWIGRIVAPTCSCSGWSRI